MRDTEEDVTEPEDSEEEEDEEETEDGESDEGGEARSDVDELDVPIGKRDDPDEDHVPWPKIPER